MAPEVLRGEEPSVASDLFALGCLAWELLAGAPPDRGPLAQVLAGQPLSVPALPVATPLNDVIARAVADGPSARFGSAAELELAAAAVAATMPLERATVQVVELPVAAAVVEADTAPQPVTAPQPPQQLTRPAPAKAAPLGDAMNLPTQALPSAAEPKRDRENRDNATRHFNVAELEVKRALAAQQRPELPGERRRRAAFAFLLFAAAVLFLSYSYERRADPGPVAPEKIPGIVPARASVPDVPAAGAHVSEEIRDREKTFERVHDDAAALKDGRRTKGNARIGRRVTDYPMLDAKKRPMSELEVAVLLDSKPVEADVLINGKLIGPSPIFVPVAPGTYKVGMERRPLAINEVPIMVPPGKSVRVEIELQPLVDGAPSP
jgi:hypothetical protein